MKITMELSDDLWAAANQLAALEKTTVKALVEEGLRKVIKERQQCACFRLRRVTFKGRGLQPHPAAAPWEWRQMIYEKHET
jgi:hypothetical protein